MNNWRKYKLGEIAEITSSKRIFLADYVSEGIPFYRSKEVIERFNKNKISTELFIEKSKFQEIKNKFGAPKEDDLLLTSVGTIGIPYLVQKKDEFYFKDGNLTWFKNYSNNILPKYLFYWIQSPIGKDALVKTIIGSTQQALTIVSLKQVEISLPDLPTQSRIARILTSFDDKIELLQQMNQTLETMAQAIFKEWFVDFNFPGFDGVLVDGLPKGWRSESIDKDIEFLNGLALQKFPPLNNDDFLPVIKIREMRQGISNSSDKASVEIPEKYIIKDGDVLFSWSGSLEVIIWCNGKGALNQHLFKVSSTKYPKWFYFYWTKHYLPAYQSIASDKATTMGHIQRKHLAESIINIPDLETFKKANNLLEPIIEKIINNSTQIQSLTHLRDTLLPRLMSGAVAVSAGFSWDSLDLADSGALSELSAKSPEKQTTTNNKTWQYGNTI